MGVDYSGAGPILAIGKAKIIFASDDVGARKAVGEDLRAARQRDGRLPAARSPVHRYYVYAVEAIAVSVKAGQVVTAGQKVATLHDVSPNLEIGWAAGHGPETLAVKDGHQCACTDPAAGRRSRTKLRQFPRLAWRAGGLSAERARPAHATRFTGASRPARRLRDWSVVVGRWLLPVVVAAVYCGLGPGDHPATGFTVASMTNGSLTPSASGSAVMRTGAERSSDRFAAKQPGKVSSPLNLSGRVKS